MQALRGSGYSNTSRSKLVQGDVESLEWSDNRKFRCRVLLWASVSFGGFLTPR
jgi:hypothetical protein